MIVQVDLYSGRPNPQWTLTRAQEAELERRLNTMPLANSGEPTQGLGYRGVILSGQGGSTGQPLTVLISAGIVLERFESGVERRKRDVDRALEAWIIGTGSDYLEASVRDYIMQQIGQR